MHQNGCSPFALLPFIKRVQKVYLRHHRAVFSTNKSVRRDPNTALFNFLHSATTTWPINFKVKLKVKTEKKYNEKRKIVDIFQNSK
jgi:hypothetical protein